MFGTLQDRLPKELALCDISDIGDANRYIREIYLPVHNSLFAKPPQIAEESAFVAVGDTQTLAEILCIEHARVVARDNTVSYEGRVLQLPNSPARPHYVKANVKVREYPDGSLAVFHGPRCLARYSSGGDEIVPTARSVTPCSPPSRRGLETPQPAARAATASLDGPCARRHCSAAGRDEETVLRSNKETDWKAERAHALGGITMTEPGRPPLPSRLGHITQERTNDVLRKPVNLTCYRQREAFSYPGCYPEKLGLPLCAVVQPSLVGGL
jgi:hypothetical protein